MTDHLDAGDLEALVRGELAGPYRDGLEAHADRCERCAAALAREAGVELALIELAAARAGAPSEHPGADELADLVRDELSGPDRDRLEAHIDGCPACSGALGREARLELALVELGGFPRARRPAPRRQGPAALARIAAAVAVAAMVAIALIVVRRGGNPPVDAGGRAPRDVICAVRSEQADCVERAHRHGLFVRYPSWAGAPPLAGSRAAGPALPPFVPEGANP